MSINVSRNIANQSVYRLMFTMFVSIGGTLGMSRTVLKWLHRIFYLFTAVLDSHSWDNLLLVDDTVLMLFKAI